MMKREPKQSTEATGPLTIEFLSAIIDHIAHPIFVKDREFRFVLLNRALGAMVGHSVPDMLGKTDYDFFPKAEADFFREKDTEMFRSGSTVVIEEEPITTASGESRILATTKVPRRDRDGQVTHLIGIIKDITDLKRAEGALREANRNLELRVTERTAKLEAAQEQLVRKERLAVLGHLAGGLAHQLRNPLGAIQNATALLARGPLDQVQHDARRVITEEVRRADQIISTLLDHARMKKPTRQRLPLTQLIEDTLAHESMPAHVSLSLHGDVELVVEVDSLQVQSALENVLRNAIDAMPDGGTIEIQLSQLASQAEIRITDSGCGVPPSARDTLFEPLVTTKPLGMGLGLSTARGLIENQDGRIDFEPTSDGGSCFIIALPLTQETIST